jgi:DNA-binding transcriptional ArsR family regulator
MGAQHARSVPYLPRKRGAPGGDVARRRAPGLLRATGGASHDAASVELGMTRRRVADEPPLRYEWERVIRALPLPSGAKHVALNAATYANADGSGIYPGNERTVADTGLSDSTVRRAYRLLRDVGLLDRIVEGRSRGRRGVADEYRLAIPDDVLERVVNAAGPPVTGTAVLTGSPVRGTGGLRGTHRSQGPDHRSQGPRPPVPGTGHQPIDQPIDQPSATVLDVPTGRARANGAQP